MRNATFTATEQLQILASANVVDAQLVAIQVHLANVGTIVPMRTLGNGEEMVLDQRDIVLAELREARSLATQWDMSDY